MRTIVLFFVAVMLVSGVSLTSHPAHALASGRGMSSASSTQPPPQCVQERVCSPRGCMWRTVCR